MAVLDRNCRSAANQDSPMVIDARRGSGRMATVTHYTRSHVTHAAGVSCLAVSLGSYLRVWPIGGPSSAYCQRRLLVPRSAPHSDEPLACHAADSGRMRQGAVAWQCALRRVQTRMFGGNPAPCAPGVPFRAWRHAFDNLFTPMSCYRSANFGCERASR